MRVDARRAVVDFAVDFVVDADVVAAAVRLTDRFAAEPGLDFLAVEAERDAVDFALLRAVPGRPEDDALLRVRAERVPAVFFAVVRFVVALFAVALFAVVFRAVVFFAGAADAVWSSTVVLSPVFCTRRIPATAARLLS